MADTHSALSVSIKGLSAQPAIETRLKINRMNIRHLDDLIAASDLVLTTEVVAPHLESCEISREEFCDMFAHRVAHRYASGYIDFDLADAAMNRLFVFGYRDVNAGDALPDYAFLVFSAFDDGEYQHAGDNASVVPDEKYTRSKIMALIKKDANELKSSTSTPKPLRASS